MQQVSYFVTPSKPAVIIYRNFGKISPSFTVENLTNEGEINLEWDDGAGNKGSILGGATIGAEQGVAFSIDGNWLYITAAAWATHRTLSIRVTY